MIRTTGGVTEKGLTGKFNDVLCFIGRGVRLEILGVLSTGPHDVTSLAKGLDLGVTTVSNHLCQMAEYGLVEVTRLKRRHVYRISDRVTAVCTSTGEHIFLATSDGGWAFLRLPSATSQAGMELGQKFLNEVLRMANGSEVPNQKETGESPSA
ncbi:MAG: ArsR family transcriptional regulator [Planctomycetota bacterium]|nr:ArsR family transcriptional regulator [Planctomycetota bacterium]